MPPLLKAGERNDLREATMIDYAKLRAAVADLATQPCAVCGENGWDTFENLWKLILRDETTGTANINGGLDVFTMICVNCASVRLYSYPHLQRLIDEKSQ
jgi:hypothetical protein